MTSKWNLDEADKNLILNKDDKYPKKNLNILNNQGLNGRIVQTSLMHDFSHGSKFNLTKSAEMVQDTFNNSNSLKIINVYIYLFVSNVLIRKI